MAYIDTSVLIAALTIEPATDRAQRWLANPDLKARRISGWTLVEFSSGLAVNVRRGALPEQDRRRAIASLELLMSRHIVSIEPILPVDFRRATALIDDHRTTLRAGDALHLAIGDRTSTTVWTLDAGMKAAAAALGVECELLT